MPVSLGGERCVSWEAQSNGSAVRSAVCAPSARSDVCVGGCTMIAAEECKSNLFLGMHCLFRDHRAVSMSGKHGVHACISFNGKHIMERLENEGCVR